MTDNHTTATYDALVALARSLRPSWHTEGIRNAVRQALRREPMPTLADLAYALVRCAIDPTIVSPAVLPLDGPHWRVTGQITTPIPPRFTPPDRRAHHRTPGAALARAALHQALGHREDPDE
jgi:hypothetical protein